MKRFRNIALALLVMSTFFIVAVCTYYNINMAKVSDNDELKEVVIKEGSIGSIANTLKSNNLIKNVTIFKVYTRLTNKSNLKAGTYNFSEDMGVKKIVDILEEGSKINPNEVSITFKEGINIRKIASLISENTNNSYDDVIAKANDISYIDSLKEKYWFITDDIKNDSIYYKLEGYLFPDTYNVMKDTDIKDIITKMLDETDNKLSKYKDSITNNKLSIHEIITLASVVELEVANKEDTSN